MTCREQERGFAHRMISVIGLSVAPVATFLN
jgi:hypothetical protein